MAIAPVSTTSASIPPPIDPMRQAFGQLTGAIQSGDLSAAQSAFAALTQAQPNQGSGPFSQALSQIGDALQSGDIGKAQQALAALQQQMQAMKGAHHHHGPAGDRPKSVPELMASPATYRVMTPTSRMDTAMSLIASAL
jgi:uncharacterized phage infection (PIP) family protein YhgE